MSAKMNPEAKAKIVEALRSGKYQQGQHALQENGCFCVWGVICDVSGKAEWEASGRTPDLQLYAGSWMAPSEEVKEWVGVAVHDDAQVVIRGVKENLMYHNDNGATFEELATAIEEQL